MPYFSRDGLAFHYQEQGAGLPFVFQHGLGGDTAQTFELFTPPVGVQLLTLECRSHGETPICKELTAKSVSFEQHVQQTRAYIEQFLMQFG